MHCTQIPESDFGPTLLKTGKKVIDVLKWVAELGY